MASTRTFNFLQYCLGLVHKIFFLVLITVIVSVFSISAQTVTHITTTQGLSTNDLTVTIKDHNNFMWIGSTNGLNKHEGSRIKVYNKIGKDSASLSSTEMHTLFEDRQGFIWVGSTGGLDKLNPVTGGIVHYPLSSGDKNSPSIGYILSITQDKYDSIWVSTSVGFFRMHPTTGHSVKIKITEKDGTGLPVCNTGYRPGITTEKGIWFQTDIGIIFYDYSDHLFYNQYHNPLHKAIFDLYGLSHIWYVSDICADQENNLYFVVKHKTLVKYNYQTARLDSFTIPFPQGAWKCCYSVVLDDHNNVWIGYRHGGILVFNNTTHQFTPILNDSTHHLLSSNYVYSMCLDYRKKMWVSTSHGLDIIDYYNEGLQAITLSYQNDFIDLKYGTGIMSYYNGMIHIPFHNKSLINYQTTENSINYMPIDAKQYGSINYVGTDSKGNEFASWQNNWTPIRFAKRSFITNFKPGLLQELLRKNKTKVTWALSSVGKEIYKFSNSKIYILQNDSIVDELSGDGFMKEATLSADKEKFLYLTAHDELVFYNLRNRHADTVAIGEACKKIGFAFSQARDLLDDGQNNTWITSQNGLLKYNSLKKKLSAYNTMNHLSHNFTYALAKDKNGMVWVASLGGIDLYDAKKNEFKNIIFFQSTTYMDAFGSSIYGEDSLIYFLSGNTLYKINPASLNNHATSQSLLQLNELNINGVPFAGDYSSEKPILSYTQNRLEFKYGLMDFTRQSRVKYFYFIEGLEKTWIDAGNKADAVYNAIQPGDYTFHLKAIDADGALINRQLNIPFRIRPPFWKTKLFILFATLLTGWLIYMLGKWRKNNIKVIEAEKLKVQQLNAAHFKGQLELEQIVNYFSSSLIDKTTEDEVLWDVAKNLIGRLGFEDCMIYVWNKDKTKMEQRAGYGLKGSAEEIKNTHFDVLPGQGVVGYVIQTKEAVLIADTSKDNRYRVDDLKRLSEITIPVKYNNELIGVIDSEHQERNFFTQQHAHVLTTIATLMANKLHALQAVQSLQEAKIEMLGINEKLSEAKLEALRSQMNPHFIFNSLNAIQECILTNQVNAAYHYLSQFSRLQRMVLNNSAKEFISLQSELEMLKLYLSLESLRFSQSFSYTINTDKTEDTDEIMLPSMLLQPYVENAIWHGLRNKEGDKILCISCEEVIGKLIITIDDNGIGRENAGRIKAQKLGSSTFDSKATIMSAERIRILSLKYQSLFSIEIKDKISGENKPQGTTVIISLPINIDTQNL
ncbi:MAG: histidine kinase [Ferruginibacter sp.]